MIKGKSYDSSHNGSRIADSAKVSQNTRNFYKLSNKLNEIDYRGHLLTCIKCLFSEGALIRFYISEPNKVSFAALLWKERSMGERGPVLPMAA